MLLGIGLHNMMHHLNGCSLISSNTLTVRCHVNVKMALGIALFGRICHAASLQIEPKNYIAKN